jgi:hypothetical protein
MSAIYPESPDGKRRGSGSFEVDACSWPRNLNHSPASGEDACPSKKRAGRDCACPNFFMASELCVVVDSQPGASLATRAASLCPRLICSAPFGGNVRVFTSIEGVLAESGPGRFRRMKPNLPRSARVSDPAETADRRSPAHPPCSAEVARSKTAHSAAGRLFPESCLSSPSIFQLF